jgi:putative peptide zinc metalloprotease protein
VGEAQDGRPPRLSSGIELLGRFEDSGFKEPPFIARRADGQVIQLPQLLYQVAEEVDGQSPSGAIAQRVSERSGRGVSADNIDFLLEKKLRPLGVVAPVSGHEPELKKADPLLALKFRTAVVPEGFVQGLSSALRPLFLPPVVLAVLGGIVTLDVWLFFVHGVAQSTRELIYNPLLLLLVFGLVVLSAGFHECGHATACRYGGARPGVMGVGIYIVWPAFYTDVTDAYRLGKWGRVRTDLGGIYFNIIFSLATAAAYFATGFEPLLVIIVLQHVEMLHQLLPVLRLDGYYIISDLTGVPDMFSRIRPTLRSLLPGRELDPRVEELKPWVRRVTTVYVVTLVPALLGLLALMLISAPRIFATAWDSLFVQLDDATDAFGDGNVIKGLASLLQTAALVLPAAGIALTTGRTGKRVGTAAWRRCENRPLGRLGLVAALAATIGILTFLWWPNGEYKPIQPGEKGTVVGLARAATHIPGGRPALTEESESRLGGAPTERERRRERRSDENAPARSSERRPSGDSRTRRSRDENAPGATPAKPEGNEAPERRRQGEPQRTAPEQPETQEAPSTTTPQETAPSTTTPEETAPSTTTPAP